MFKRFNLSHFDATIMLVGVSLIAVGSYYYQTDFNDTLLSTSDKAIGRLIEGSGNQKKVADLFWLPLQNESKIWNGDKIFANQDQQVNIELIKSKAIVSVPKESLVVITENQDDIVLTLDRGEISIASGEKEIQFKIRSTTGVSKSIKVEKNSVVNLVKVDSSTLLSVKQGKADLVLNTQEKDIITVQANDIVEVSSSNLEKIKMNNILRTKDIDPLVDNNLSLVSDKFDGQTIEIYQSLADRAISTKVVKIDKIEMDEIGPGNYFVRVANSQILDRFQVKEYKAIEVELKEFSKPLLQGDKIDFRWSNPKAHTVEVTINSPSGDLFRKITTGNQLAFYPQESGAHNISVVPVKKVGAKHESVISESLKLSEETELFVADSVLNNIETKLDEKSDVKRSSVHNVTMITTLDGVSLQKRTFENKKINTSDLTFDFFDSKRKLKIIGVKEGMIKDGDKQQIARTRFLSGQGKEEVELYERSNIDKNIPSLRKAKTYDSRGRKTEELIARYNSIGKISSVTLFQGRRKFDQHYENGKVVAIDKVYGKEISPSILSVAAAFVAKNALEASSSGLSVSAKYIPLANTAGKQFSIALDSPVRIKNNIDEIDIRDNYIKKIEVESRAKGKIRYELLTANRSIVHAGVLKSPDIQFENLDSGDYQLNFYLEGNQGQRIGSSKVSVAPRISSVKVNPNTIKKTEGAFEIPLKWNSPVEENVVEFFENNSTTPIITKVIKGTSANIKVPNVNNLTWRVRGSISSVLPSKKSKIAPPDLLKELPVPAPIIMKYKKDFGGCYSFDLPKIPNSTKYFIEVYEDANRTKMVFNRWLDNPEVCWQSSRHGKYFYRYKYFDSWNRQSSFSMIGEIIFPISPLTEF